MIWLVSFIVVYALADFARTARAIRRGPKPSKEEREKSQSFIADYIAQYPHNCGDLPKQFPEAKRRANAYIAYQHLNKLYKCGAIDLQEYTRELDKILPAIDISDVACK